MSRLQSDLKSKRFWTDFASSWLAAAGMVGLATSLVAAFSPELLINQYHFIWLLLAFCVIVAAYRAWPRPVVQEFEAGYQIRVVVGDLFAQGANVVVGMCDTFDVETPDIIHGSSVQGQMLERIWNGDADTLVEEILEQLSSTRPVEQVVKPGNQWRYPIGTVVPLRRGGLIYFCVAYSHLDEANKATATLEGFTQSLYRTWDAVDSNGNGARVCCPLVGQGLSRLNVLNREASLRLVALTFALRSNKGRIASGLDLVLRQEDADRVELREFAAFLRSLPGAVGR